MLLCQTGAPPPHHPTPPHTLPGFASAYIAVPGRKADEKGTGGSDFMPALASYRDATARHVLP